MMDLCNFLLREAGARRICRTSASVAAGRPEHDAKPEDLCADKSRLQLILLSPTKLRECCGLAQSWRDEVEHADSP